MTQIRLNKFLAHHTGTSRREADEMIEQGRVQVANLPARLGQSIDPSTEVVTLDGTIVERKSEFTYLLLNKPIGYVCSRRQQGDHPTIYALLPEKYHALKPVGRLDHDSSGLILLTDDGDFAHRMTHPRFRKTKLYEVELDKPLQPLHQQMISDFGVMLEDGKSQFLVTRREAAERTEGESQEARGKSQDNPQPATPHHSDNAQHEHQRALGGEAQQVDSLHLPTEGQAPLYEREPLLVTLTEGRNRQIRRTFAALGYTVTRLHRTRFGSYNLALNHGEFTEVQPN